MPSANWKDILQSKGMLKDGRIVSPTKGAAEFHFHPSGEFSQFNMPDGVLKVAVTYDDVFIIAQFSGSGTWTREQYYRWEDLRRVVFHE